MLDVPANIAATSVITAFIAGISASVHCVTMCGGISLCVQRTPQKTVASSHQNMTQRIPVNAPRHPFRHRLSNTFMPFLIPLMPHLLRISTYALLAFLFYHFSSLMPFLKTPGAQAPRWLLGVGLLFAAIYNFQSSRHCTQCPKSHATHPQNVNTERSPISGSHAQSAAPHASNSHTWIRWFWGLLPCPLVIAMLIASRGTDSAMHAATFMFCFGLGTLPALIGFTWTTQRTFSTLGKSSRHWFTRYWFKSTFWVNKHQVLTALLFIGGLWTIGSEWLMPHHHHHHVATQNTQDTSPHSIRQLTRHTSTTPQPARTHTHE